MASPFRLEPNRFDPEAHDYIVKGHSARSVNEEQFIAETGEYRSTVTPADMRASFEVIKATACRLVREGININTSLFKIRNTPRGRVGADAAMYPPVETGVSMSPGLELQAAAEENLPQRTPTGSADHPCPLFYTDDLSHTANRMATIGGDGQFLGERLRFDPTDPNQGVFLVDVESGEAFRADVSVGSIEPGSMSIRIPSNLVAGRTYHIEMRSIFENSSTLVTGRMFFQLIAQNASA